MNDEEMIYESYLQILEESRVERYLNMYNKLFKIFPDAKDPNSKYNPAYKNRKGRAFGNPVGIIERLYSLKDVIDTLKRDDIIQWYIRKTLYNSMVVVYGEFLLDKIREGNKLEDVNSYYQDRIFKNYDDEYNKFFDDYNTLLSTLEHYLSLNINQINNFRFRNQSISDVINYFKQIEKEWAATSSGIIDITEDLNSGRVKRLLKISDETEWQIIDSSFCTEEGKAMGHCGNNTGSSDSNTKLLSYRTITKKGNKILARPHLTFIYHLNDKSLSERKGRQNDKPIEKYHNAILKLLMFKQNGEFFIERMTSKGYLPQNNFMISDLSKDNQKLLKKERPDLFDNSIDI